MERPSAQEPDDLLPDGPDAAPRDRRFDEARKASRIDGSRRVQEAAKVEDLHFLQPGDGSGQTFRLREKSQCLASPAVFGGDARA
jgi:hypothetical protein